MLNSLYTLVKLNFIFEKLNFVFAKFNFTNTKFVVVSLLFATILLIQKSFMAKCYISICYNRNEGFAEKIFLYSVAYFSFCRSDTLLSNIASVVASATEN